MPSRNKNFIILPKSSAGPASRVHQGLATCKILGNSDEGILRGQVGEKKSLTPISPQLGRWALIFFSSDRAIGAPYTGKVSARRIEHGTTDKFSKKFPILGVTSLCQMDFQNCGLYQSVLYSRLSRIRSLSKYRGTRFEILADFPEIAPKGDPIF